MRALFQEHWFEDRDAICGTREGYQLLRSRIEQALAAPNREIEYWIWNSDDCNGWPLPSSVVRIDQYPFAVASSGWEFRAAPAPEWLSVTRDTSSIAGSESGLRRLHTAVGALLSSGEEQVLEEVFLYDQSRRPFSLHLISERMLPECINDDCD